MVELREPMAALVRDPLVYTSHLRLPDPSSIVLYDETLRDGEQMPGVAFAAAEKVRLASLLADCGVGAIAVAFPVTSRSDRDAWRLTLDARRRGVIPSAVQLVAMCRATRADIDTVVEIAREAGCRPDDVAVNILSTTSDLHLKYKLGRVLLARAGRGADEWLATPVAWYREANVALVTEAVTYGRSLGIGHIEVSAEDATRGDREYLIEWALAARAAGAERFVFADTCGVATPESVDHYVPPLVERLGVKHGRAQLTAHFHNDFGLAAHNTVRAVLHGATHPSVTVNGIGERAGNTSLHQFVMVLKELYGIALPSFRYDRLRELRRVVEEMSGIPVQPHEPIVGEGVFAHESGIHTAALLIHPAMYQFIRAEDVGGARRFVFGKHSGVAAVAAVLRDHEALLQCHGIVPDDAFLNAVLQRIKTTRERDSIEGRTRERLGQYYRDYEALGISEPAVITIALEIAASTAAARSTF